MSKGSGHTSVRQGKKVLVFLSSGEPPIIAKFKEHKDSRILFYDHEPIRTRLIRTLSIYKPRETNAPAA